MPPKQQASKKTVDKQKQKVIEDKTFGLKNKNKSKKVAQYVAGVETQVKGKKENIKTYEDKKREEKEKEAEKMEQSLFKPVPVTKVPVGVDPKSIVCEFFKRNMCTKGDKCKYSHNLEVARKTEKIDIYTDRRESAPEETMETENWDQNKLEKVVEQKHQEANGRIKTKIICKYFIEAVENKKYGWFWECPNGGDKCQYVHALPPEEEVDETPLEEILEAERAKLTTRTPLTLELFLKWKEDRKVERAKREEEEKKQRDLAIKAGKQLRSGREMFLYDPSLFVDDDNVIDTDELEPEPEEDEGPVRVIDATGTSISMNIINGGNGEEGNGVQVEESLFQDDIDVPDEEEDNQGNGGKEEVEGSEETEDQVE